MSVAVAVKLTLAPAVVGVAAEDEPSLGPIVIVGAVLNTQPELLPPSVEWVPGFQVAPPAAAE